MPQKNAHVEGSTAERKLTTGNTRYTIFETDIILKYCIFGIPEKYIFKISSTREKLYRFKSALNTNEVKECAIFKRVRSENPEMKQLCRLKHSKMSCGSPTLFDNKMYDVFAISAEDESIRGYILQSSSTHGYGQATSSEKMYFAFEKYE